MNDDRLPATLPSPADADADCNLTITGWNAEFEDPALELEYQTVNIEATARRVRMIVGIAGPAIFLYGLADVAILGVGRVFAMVFVARLAVLASALYLIVATRRDPLILLRVPLVTVFEVIYCSTLIMAALLRPDFYEAHNLNLALSMIAIFLFLPNRFSDVVAINAVLLVSYLVVGGSHFDVSATHLMTFTASLVTFYALGVIGANQLQRGRREEYLALKQQRAANDRLVEEIGRREQLQGELTHMATHDALTDLLNRHAFYELAEREAAQARRTSQPVSVLVIDADEFKLVNDRFGHHSGDEALKHIAASFKRHLRGGDIVARLGGEEFAIVLPGMNRIKALEVAQRLCATVAEQPLEHPNGPIFLSVSIGVAECQLWSESLPDALSRADANMYAAKVEGRNRVVCL